MKIKRGRQLRGQLFSVFQMLTPRIFPAGREVKKEIAIIPVKIREMPIHKPKARKSKKADMTRIAGSQEKSILPPSPYFGSFEDRFTSTPLLPPTATRPRKRMANLERSCKVINPVPRTMNIWGIQIGVFEKYMDVCPLDREP
jgi:hypothetical protein